MSFENDQRRGKKTPVIAVVILAVVILICLGWFLRDDILEAYYVTRLESEDQEARRSAARGLAEIGSRSAMRRLLESCAPRIEVEYSEEDDDLPYGARLISGRGEASITVLDEAMRDATASQDLRRAAFKLLAEIGPVALPSLEKAVADVDPQVRAYALSALRNMAIILERHGRDEDSRRRAVLGITSRFTDEVADVRSYAIVCCRGTHAGPAVEPLTELLADGDEEARRGSIAALQRIGVHAGAAMPALVESLRDESEEIRSAAKRALEWVHPRVEDEPFFRAALGDEDESVRDAAAKALKVIEILRESEE